MAMFCELSVVLDFIRGHTDAYYEIQKDKVADNLYGQECDPPLPYSSSLDAAEKLWRSKQMEMNDEDDQKDDAHKEEQKTVSTVEVVAADVRKASSTDTSQWFVRAPVSDIPDGASLLTAAFSVEKENDERLIEVTVHVPTGYVCSMCCV